jgi:hypothetical protein
MCVSENSSTIASSGTHTRESIQPWLEQKESNADDAHFLKRWAAAARRQIFVLAFPHAGRE